MKKVLAFSVGMILGVALIITGYYEWRDSKQLAVEGKSTVVEVSDHYTHKARRSRRKYYLVISFQTESQQARSRKVPVSSDIYDKAVSSRMVRVHYLPGDPEVVQAGPKVEIKYARMIAGVVILVFSVGTWLFYRIAPNFRKGHNLSKAKPQRIAAEDEGKATLILHRDVAKEHAKQDQKVA